MVGKSMGACASLFRLGGMLINYAAVRSPWMLHMDNGGCNEAWIKKRSDGRPER